VANLETGFGAKSRSHNAAKQIFRDSNGHNGLSQESHINEQLPNHTQINSCESCAKMLHSKSEANLYVHLDTHTP
jgi:hypothetical protein